MGMRTFCKSNRIFEQWNLWFKVVRLKSSYYPQKKNKQWLLNFDLQGFGTGVFTMNWLWYDCSFDRERVENCRVINTRSFKGQYHGLCMPPASDEWHHKIPAQGVIITAELESVKSLTPKSSWFHEYLTPRSFSLLCPKDGPFRLKFRYLDSIGRVKNLGISD